MKTRIDIITGFLESGKTSFLNFVLASGVIKEGERTIILLCEEGEEEIAKSHIACKNIILETLMCGERPEEYLFYRLLRTYQPARILVEYNGTWPIEDLLSIRLPPKTHIGRILYVANAHSFLQNERNMGSLISEQIVNSDVVILNRSHDVSPQQISEIRRTVRSTSRNTDVVLGPEGDTPWHFTKKYLQNTDEFMSAKAAGLIFLLSVLWAVLLFSGTFPVSRFTGEYQTLLEINTAFLSILIQALPFLLLGVFISALLQSFVSEKMMIRVFSQKRGVGFLAAVLLGIFFPICDCAMVPITARLIRKGTPIPQTITFMLASPAVNPIVILSTWYAFRGQPSVVVWRVATGIVVAVAAGLILLLAEKMAWIRRDEVMIEEVPLMYAATMAGKESRVERMLRQAGTEFFRTAPLLVTGAFLSAVVTHFLPTDFFSNMSGQKIAAVFIMLIAAFFLSICSNSNAFVARNFANAFPLTAVIGFMVMGPMLDVKNLLVLRSTFKKKFIVSLVCLLFAISFLLFCILVSVAGGRL